MLNKSGRTSQKVDLACSRLGWALLQWMLGARPSVQGWGLLCNRVGWGLLQDRG